MHTLQFIIVLTLLTAASTDVLGQSSRVHLASDEMNLINAFPNLEFNQPLLLTHAGDGSDRVFVVEKPGIVHVFGNQPDVMSTEVFLDITDRILPPGDPNLGETGLLSMAFHPQYASNGLLYISYVDENLVSIISELSVSTSDPSQADLSSERVLLSMQQPQRNHNGGHIAFGMDGYLYIAFGDGFSESARDGIESGDPLGHGQNPETWFSSLLRIDVDQQQDDLAYSIPADNPFAGNQDGWQEEIFAYGFRNPWRFSVDREDGTLWLADVGDKKAEEINIVEPGENYGWNIKEASHCFEDVPCDTTLWGGLTDPVFEYLRDVGESITGGYVYRGTQFPSLLGKYIYGDFDFGAVWALSIENGEVRSNEVLVADAGGGISSFGEDEAGEVYIVDFGGRIWAFEPLTDTSTEVPETPDAPFAATSNYPNPFSTETRVLIKVDEPVDLTLRVFDVLGRQVHIFSKQYQTPGDYEIIWDGLDESGRKAAPGPYLYAVQAGQFRSSGTMVLLR